MEIRITAYVLRYLLEHRFPSKAEMARQLGIHQRTMERIFENLDDVKAGTIAFDHAIEYCAKHHLSLDAILERFAEDVEGVTETETADRQAYRRLQLNKPENLTADGEDVFLSMLQFLQEASAQMCPYCETWCNPWDGKHRAEEMDCCIGYMAREIVNDTAEFYTKEGHTE